MKWVQMKFAASGSHHKQCDLPSEQITRTGLANRHDEGRLCALKFISLSLSHAAVFKGQKRNYV